MSLQKELWRFRALQATQLRKWETSSIGSIGKNGGPKKIPRGCKDKPPKENRPNDVVRKRLKGKNSGGEQA